MHIVECDADVALATTLTLIPERRIVHAHGKHQILRRLVGKCEDSIGMIDQDPHSSQAVKFLDRFREVAYSRSDIRILHYARKNNRLIVLCPRLEEWILKSSRIVNVDIARYNLPNNANQLHEIVNFRINRFKQLVEELAKNSDRVKELRGHLTQSS